MNEASRQKSMQAAAANHFESKRVDDLLTYKNETKHVQTRDVIASGRAGQRHTTARRAYNYTVTYNRHGRAQHTRSKRYHFPVRVPVNDCKQNRHELDTKQLGVLQHVFSFALQYCTPWSYGLQ